MIGDGPAITYLADYVNGYGFTGEDLDGERLPVVRIQHLLDRSVPMDRTDRSVPQVAIQSGDLIFSWSATLATRIWDRGPALLNQHLFRVDPRPGVDTRWLKYVLDVACDALSGHMHGSAMTHITRDMMRRVRVPLPSEEEQRAIADFLDIETARIDALVARKRRLIELLDERFQSSLELWAEGLIADGAARLRHVCRVERGRFTHRPRNDPSLYQGPYPFAQTGDIRQSRKALESCSQTLNERGRATSRSFPSGTILMAIAANVGDIAVTTFETWAPDSVVGFVPNDGLESDYLYFWLLGVRHRINESSTENTQENTNIDLLGALPIVIPPRAVQVETARRFETTRLANQALQLAVDRETALLTERRGALVAAAVAGGLKVPVAA